MCSELSNRKKVLVCATGSVAAIKIPEIIKELKQKMKTNVEIRFIPTEKALHFLPNLEDQVINKFEDLKEFPFKVFRDEDEWSSWHQRGDPVLHIELRKWADLLVIAPLDANTLAKLSNGMCDNLLTCICRAWDFKKPILFAPAMNTFMWDHPVTITQINTLKSWGYTEIPPIEKTLMCNDKGVGAMAEPQTIVERIVAALNLLEI